MVYIEMAKLVFETCEKDQEVKPAKIINCFQSAEEQTEAASLFNSNLLGEVEEADRQKLFLIRYIE